MSRWVALALMLLAVAADAAPLGTRFDYQGELRVSGQPVTAAYDFEVALYAQETFGAAIDTVTVADVAVTQGLFSLALDYTDVPFQASTQYWLELRVRDGASTGTYTPLLPRQQLNATPYALHARTVDATSLVSTVPARPQATSQRITLPGTPPTVAGDTSVTTGVDGLSIASVYDATNGDLLVVHCDDATCTQRTVTTLDSSGIVGRGNSIIIGTNGLPAISYFDETNGDLKLARCANTRCTSAATGIVDPAVGASRRSVALDGFADAIVAIVYHDEAQGDVEAATCDNTGACTLATIESANNVGRALDAVRYGQLIFIAYGDETAGSVKIRRCLSIAGCVGDTATTVDAAGAATEVALAGPSGGTPTILYVRGGDLRSAKCTNSTCTTLTLGPVLFIGTSYVAATVGTDGLPFIALLNAARSSISYLKCVDYGCASALTGGGFGTTTVDARPGATLGSHGYPVVSARVVSSFGLEICDNPECASGRMR